MKLDERKRNVLQAIVIDYIETAEPVGSRSLARKYNLGVSPATIRNEMADLEELGLIEQPHTSAGRIPTNIGYRFYVDCLMEKYHVEENIAKLINSAFNKIRQVEDIVEETSKLLSQLTNYTALVSSPHYSHSTCQSIHLLPYKNQQALVVIVGEGGLVEHKIIDIPEHFTAADLTKINTVLNNRLIGKSLNSWHRTLLQEIFDELSKQQQVLREALKLLEDALKHDIDREKVILCGTLNILNFPEFKNVDKVKALLEFLEQKEKIRDILVPDPEHGISIKIGTENVIQNLQDFSIITTTYSINGKTFGKLGLLGPTRMEYAKTIALVEMITTTLNDILRKV